MGFTDDQLDFLVLFLMYLGTACGALPEPEQ